MCHADGFAHGFAVLLYPRDNDRVANAVAQYRDCLTGQCQKSFADWTLESVAHAIQQHTSADWIRDLIDRYLNFEKLSRA